MATKKPTNNDADEAIALAAAAASNAKKSIKSLKSHILSDPLSVPQPRSSTGSVLLLNENDLRAMSHDELVEHAMKLTDSILHSTHMSIHADRNRVAYGIQGNNRVLAVAEVATELGKRVLRTNEGRKRAAASKLANDPKQAAKTEAHKLWQDWQAGRTIHRSGAAFARHVVDETVIESTTTVERWIRIWRRESEK